MARQYCKLPDHGAHHGHDGDATINLFTEFEIDSPADIIRIVRGLAEDGDIERVNIFTELVTKIVAEHVDEIL